ncbi:MAG: alpha/beta hydrolase, partial [Pseudomonadales bacterium]
ADLRTPLTGDVPTLVLSGEEDPITPPAYGERVAASLERSRALVAPGQGHGVVGRGCLPLVVADFVDTADPDRLDTGCIERLGHEPFFVNLMGPVARPAQTDPAADTP